MPVNGDKAPGKLVTQEQLEVTQVDNALRVETDEPHLVSMGSGRLSTAVTIHPLPVGITKIGTRQAAEPQDIAIEGTGVAERHCYIENLSGVITLHPIAPLCAIDGKLITQPTRLAQGSMVVLGRSNYFRFNHPQEARKIKDAMQPNYRISCVPLNFLHGFVSEHCVSAELPKGQTRLVYLKREKGGNYTPTFKEDPATMKYLSELPLACGVTNKYIYPQGITANSATVNCHPENFIDDYEDCPEETTTQQMQHDESPPFNRAALLAASTPVLMFLLVGLRALIL